MGTKIKENGFKVTPKGLKTVGIDLENWPTLSEALQAKKEADIVSHKGIEPFSSKLVKLVLNELERRHYGEYSEFFNRLDAFNYGYILGIRAERARRKKGTNEN